MEIVLCSCCIVCAVIVLRIHEYPPIAPIPNWARKFFLLKMARYLRMRVINETIESEDYLDESNKHIGNTNNHNGNLKVTLVALKEKKKEDNAANHSQILEQEQENDSRYKAEIIESMKLMKRYYNAIERREIYEAQWRDLARVIDTLFLIFWTIIFAITHLFFYLFLYGNIPIQMTSKTD